MLTGSTKATVQSNCLKHSSKKRLKSREAQNTTLPEVLDCDDIGMFHTSTNTVLSQASHTLNPKNKVKFVKHSLKRHLSEKHIE